MFGHFEGVIRYVDAELPEARSTDRYQKRGDGFAALSEVTQSVSDKFVAREPHIAIVTEKGSILAPLIIDKVMSVSTLSQLGQDLLCDCLERVEDAGAV